MSQKVTTRKGAINEEKEKRQSDSPAKEMKKKMAVTAEKEKQAAEKSEKVEKSEKQPEKSTTEKNAEKNADKKDKTDKKEAKDKKESQPEKPNEDTSKGDIEKNGKTDKPESKQKGKVHNGVSDVTLSANGGADELNGGHDADDDDDVMLVIDDDDQHDHLFPELTYDTSDTECFDAPTPDAPSRSLTRRSQVKSTRTPETPRPASDKQTDKENDESKDSKVLKLKEDAPASDRKLRSSDSPKRDSKKTEAKKQDAKEDEGEKKAEEPKEQEKAEVKEQKESVTPVAEVHPEVKESERSAAASEARSEQFEMEVVVEVEADEEPRKLDTNYSKSRVKVSPYRRSRSIADQTTSSVMANYTGNNTTMEMDITETSVASTDESALDRSFLRAIRNIRGRNSYKQLDTLNIKHLVNRNRPTLNTSGAGAGREAPREVREAAEAVSRPTAPVVGRKRGADPAPPEPAAAPAHKRGRLLTRLAHSLRRADTAPEIVGINTDLPLTAPVASAETFDPERLKTSPLDAEPPAPLATPLAPHETRDNKRCLIM